MNDTKAKVDTIRLQNLSYGHKQAGVLMAAVELDLFTKISEGASTVSEVAEAVDQYRKKTEAEPISCITNGYIAPANTPDVTHTNNDSEDY